MDDQGPRIEYSVTSEKSRSIQAMPSRLKR